MFLLKGYSLFTKCKCNDSLILQYTNTFQIPVYDHYVTVHIT